MKICKYIERRAYSMMKLNAFTLQITNHPDFFYICFTGPSFVCVCVCVCVCVFYLFLFAEGKSQTSRHFMLWYVSMHR